MTTQGDYQGADFVDVGVYRGSPVRMLCPDAGDYIQGTIRQSKTLWMRDTLAYILRYVPHASHVVDIGGYTGSSALWFSCMAGAHVTVVEPDVHAYDILRANVAASGVAGTVRTVHAAIWDQDGLASASLRNAANLGATQFRLCTGFGGDSVPMMRLDTLLSGGTLAPGMLYLSMEGNEWRAVRGARNTISQYRPVIAVTMWPPTGVCGDPAYDCLDAYAALVHELASLKYVLMGAYHDTAVYMPKEAYVCGM